MAIHRNEQPNLSSELMTDETKRELEFWAPIEEYIQKLISDWKPKGAFTAEDVVTILAGNIRTFAKWFAEQNAPKPAPKRWVCPFCGTGYPFEEVSNDGNAFCGTCRKTFPCDARCQCKPGKQCDLHLIDELQMKLRGTQRALEDSYNAARSSEHIRSELGLHQTFTREVSTFHRQYLSPLVSVVKQIMEQSEKIADGEAKTRLGEVVGLLKTIEERTNHFEKQALVAKAHQKAEDELKRLTVKVS